MVSKLAELPDMPPADIRHVTAGVGAKALVEIRAAGSKPPIFCLHAQTGHLRLYRNLVQHLDEDRPLYGLQGVLSDESMSQAQCRFEDMARHYIREVREFQPTGPYLLLGECDGAELAYEVAQQLRALGEDVSMLALVDSFGPAGPQRRWFAPKPAYRLVDTVRMVGFHLRTGLQARRTRRVGLRGGQGRSRATPDCDDDLRSSRHAVDLRSSGGPWIPRGARCVPAASLRGPSRAVPRRKTHLGDRARARPRVGQSRR